METNKKIFKILSIDGGGIKGLYSLYVLKALEEKFCKEGETLSDYFDMICGASTGGIIALGIATGASIKDIISVYEKNGDKIFPNYKNENWLTQKAMSLYHYMSQFWSYKYDETHLTKVMDNFFGKRTLKDSKNLLCIPSYQINTGANVVFKYPFNNDMICDGTILMRDAALATSAAPTYLPPHHIAQLEGYFADGGIWANDPSMIGITDALNYFVGPNKEFSNYDVLSIGNIIVKKQTLKPMKSYWGGKNLVEIPSVFMFSNDNCMRHFSHSLCDKTGGKMTRIECSDFPFPDDAYMDNSDLEFMIKLIEFGKRDGIRYLTDTAYRDKYNLCRFFTEKKSFVTVQ